MEYIKYISNLFRSHLTKSCSHISASCFVVAIDIIPLIEINVDISTVLASICPSIIWFPRIPVGENDTLASCFKNPMSLRVTIGDAEPEFNFPSNKVAPLDLGKDGSVLLSRVDLNEASRDLLLLFAELLRLALCQ